VKVTEATATGVEGRTGRCPGRKRTFDALVKDFLEVRSERFPVPFDHTSTLSPLIPSMRNISIPFGGFQVSDGPMKRTVHLLILLVLGTTACSRNEGEKGTMPTGDYKAFALRFTQFLARRDYEAAYAMTAKEYQGENSLEDTRQAFESPVPPDFKIGDIEVGETMTSWPGKEASDLAWVYVSIGGDVYSEAISVVVTREGGELKIREVEWGRP
jgi:hypothetical protein